MAGRDWAGAPPTAWDADVVATRCALSLDVAARKFTGRAALWVRAPRATCLRLHCRGVTIKSIEVNNEAARWRLRDPISEIAATKVKGAGSLEAAAWLSAAEEACKAGELEIEVPAKTVLSGLPAHDGTDDAFARKARRSCAAHLPSVAGDALENRLVVIEYEGTDGLDFTPASGKATACLTRARRGAAPDVNGLRCWCPCVDRTDVTCAWRLEVTVTEDLGVACGGTRRPDINGASCYDIAKARARSVGFVVGRFVAKETAVNLASTKACLESGPPKLTRVDTDTPSHYRSLNSDATTRESPLRDDPITQTPDISRPDLARAPSSISSEPWIPPTPGRAVSRTLSGTQNDRTALFVFDERQDVIDQRRETARARAVSGALEALSDAAQFYGAFLKCAAADHAVVLLDDVPQGTCVSFANLTILKRSLACGLDRCDVGCVGDAVALALFESLALQLACDDDCTLANGIPWYILLKYVDRSRGRDAASALTKFMRDDLNVTKDPLNAGCVGCLALKELETQGRQVVRDALRNVASSHVWSRDALQACFVEDVDRTFKALVSNALGKSVQVSYAYEPQKHLVVCELSGDKQFRGPLSVRVVEAESGWDYEKVVETSTHTWEFGCRGSGGAYASLRQKHGRHHHIASKALTEDDRKRVTSYDESRDHQQPKIPPRATRRPWRAKRDEPERATDAAEFAQRAVDQEKKRKRKREEKGKDTSSSSDSSSEDEESNDEKPRRAAVEAEDVLRAARSTQDPVLYVAADPERARFRTIQVSQSCKAWVERLIGDDECASQLESVDALTSVVHGEVEDRLLAARALACVARGSSKRRDASVATRASCVAALAAWQRLELVRAQEEKTPPSAFGDAQLRVAFDERFRRNGRAFPHGCLRAPSFRRDDAKAADALALKTALVAALGDARPHRAKRRARGADDALLRLVEVLRHHHEVVDDDAVLPSDLFIAHALAALAQCCRTSGSAKDLEKAKKQAQRYLDWDLRHRTSVNACVASAALHALCHVSKALCRRAMVAPAVPGERDSDEDQVEDDAKKVQARLRVAAEREAVLLPRAYAGAQYPRAVRATAVRLALDLASEVKGQLASALAWCIATLEGEETYVRRIGGAALVSMLRGEDAAFLKARPGSALGVPCGLDLDEPLLGRPRVRADAHAVKEEPIPGAAKVLSLIDAALTQRPACFDAVWRRCLLDVRFALGAPQDALVAKDKLPPELGVHVDAVAALDKRRFSREAPACYVTKSTAPKFKFTVKRKSQFSLSPGVSPGGAGGAA